MSPQSVCNKGAHPDKEVPGFSMQGLRIVIFEEKMAKKPARRRKVLSGTQGGTPRVEAKPVTPPATPNTLSSTAVERTVVEQAAEAQQAAAETAAKQTEAQRIAAQQAAAEQAEAERAAAQQAAAEQAEAERAAAQQAAAEQAEAERAAAQQAAAEQAEAERAAAQQAAAEQAEAERIAAAQAVHRPLRPVLHIVHIAPEMAPVAKVGGLADVVFGLTRELAIRGNHVEIILPKYASLHYDQIWDLHEVYHDLHVPWYDGAIHCSVYFGLVHERRCYFIEPHSPDNFFNRESIYGFADDLLRFAFFSRAAMEFLWKAGKHPDILHCHDWQTALVPVLLYEMYQRLGMTHPRACLTIHNFKHQGLTGVEMLRATGLHNESYFFDINRLRDNNNPSALNLLKGGIVYANFVTTVSPRYAFETKDQGQGFGLEPTLHTHQVSYGGVVNGIDYSVWNPEIDTHIPAPYSVDAIDRKYENKHALRHRLMLADNEKPIVAFIGRLDPQKGLELVRHAIFYALERGAQFVLLGSSPEAAINTDFWNLKHMLNDSPDCHLEIGFDEGLAHLIYAGADMLLVPSRFEPCGLTQLIALRYGTIPIVREVGGLADTVFDKDHSQRALHERNGYVFQNYANSDLESALSRAIACYYSHPEDFRELMKNAMRCDYSWNSPAEDYLNIYDYIRDK
jgi:starch synthase